jgi:ABC-type Fe3+-hydroxamate transport system substrate-binding protein
VLALRPDVVLVNVEENRRADADALRAAGIEVYVTYPRTVDGALDELERLLRFLGVHEQPPWLRAARTAWAAVPPVPPRRAAVPVWRRPWVLLGADTFAGDVLRRLGVSNVYADSADRYPRPTLDEIHATRPDLVALPDEPYPFSATDGPDAFPTTPCVLLSGRHLTWYGPSLADAPTVLAEQLANPVTRRWAGSRPPPTAS